MKNSPSSFFSSSLPLSLISIFFFCYVHVFSDIIPLLTLFLQDTAIGNVSPEESFDSDLNSDVDGSEHDESVNESDDSDSDGVENWDGIPEDQFARDIPAATPLPEPDRKKSRLQHVNALVFWLV